MNNENKIKIDKAFNKPTTHTADIYFANSPSLHVTCYYFIFNFEVYSLWLAIYIRKQ